MTKKAKEIEEDGLDSKGRPPIEISTNFDKDLEKLLLTRGMDRLVLANKRATFLVDEVVTHFKPTVKDVVTRRHGTQKQIDVTHKLFKNPLKKNGVFVVNSFPTDTRAKMYAASLMAQASIAWSDLTAQQRRGRSLPLWVRILGSGDFDQIKTIKDSNPCMLVISNINDESSQHKAERLRDILDVFDNIPRIVVTAGEDPISFMMRRVFYPIDGAVRLGSDNRINIMEM